METEAKIGSQIISLLILREMQTIRLFYLIETLNFSVDLLALLIENNNEVCLIVLLFIIYNNTK